jgi:hypothetical protein
MAKHKRKTVLRLDVHNRQEAKRLCGHIYHFELWYRHFGGSLCYFRITARNATEGRIYCCFVACYSLKIWFKVSVFESECGKIILLSKIKKKKKNKNKNRHTIFRIFKNKLQTYTNMN